MRRKYPLLYVVSSFLGLWLYVASITYAQTAAASYNDLIVDSLNDSSIVEPTSNEIRSSAIDVGQYSSIARTTGNMPVISYYDNTHGDLKLAICNVDITCTNPTIMTLDSVGVVGRYSSLALTTDNIPVISYYDVTNKDLKIAICNDTACTSPIVKPLDTVGDVGIDSSIDLTSTNSPVISYYDATNTNLKLAICSDRTCTTTRIVTVDGESSSVGQYSSVALTTSNIPIVSYYAAGAHDRVKIAFCGNVNCSAITYKSPVASGAGGDFTSIALTSTNIPVVSYRVNNTNLQISVCDDAACNSVTNKILDSTSNVGAYTSVTLTSANIPMVSYRDVGNQSLKLATCGDAACTTATNKNIAVSGNVGSFSSIILTSTNIPFISYYDATNKNLRLYRELYPITTVDNGQPNTFSKTIPTNNSIHNSSTVTLSWDSSMYASSYEYCFATSAGACTNWTDVGTSTSVVQSDLVNGTTYHWQVRASNTVGSTMANRSEIWQFEVMLPPATFNKAIPTNNRIHNSSTVTLSWNSSTYASGYEYCFATSAGACTNWTDVGTSTSVIKSNLVNGTTYHWQVRATNTVGSTIANRSAIWQFKVMLSPAAFAKVAPKNNATVQTTRVTLLWKASKHAVRYEYCISLTTKCTKWTNVGKKLSVTVSGLAKGKTYYWQARAVNTVGKTLALPIKPVVWKFKIAR